MSKIQIYEYLIPKFLIDGAIEMFLMKSRWPGGMYSRILFRNCVDLSWCLIPKASSQHWILEHCAALAPGCWKKVKPLIRIGTVHVHQRSSIYLGSWGKCLAMLEKSTVTTSLSSLQCELHLYTFLNKIMKKGGDYRMMQIVILKYEINNENMGQMHPGEVWYGAWNSW